MQCKSKHGHSGRPAINDNGEVIDIVSRGDALEDDRCYLAPARPLHQLMKKAKAKRSKGKPEARVRLWTLSPHFPWSLQILHKHLCK